MNPFIVLMVFIMFLYTVGFSIQLWKEKNKPGSLAVFFLALTIAIAPYFTIIR